METMNFAGLSQYTPGNFVGTSSFETFCQVSSAGFQRLGQPVIRAQPSYRGLVLQNILAGKSKNMQDISLESPQVPGKFSTPYRLPRITPRSKGCLHDIYGTARSTADRVWGQFGYEENVVRLPKLGPRVHNAMVTQPPVTVSVSDPAVPEEVVRSVEDNLQRQSTLLGENTGSETSLPCVRINVMKEINDISVHEYKSLLEKAARLENHLHNPAPTPVPSSRCGSPPANSSASVHWALGSSKHPQFDCKGGSHKQGPYSREFTVHCVPPPNWLRMKWGRRSTA